jgi:phospholipid transport system substrate-binding protein
MPEMKGIQQRMNTVMTMLRGGTVGRHRPISYVAGCFIASLCALWTGPVAGPAAAADPAVVFMAQVGRELMAAARTRSPGVMANVVQRFGDVHTIGNYSLGAYRAKLAEGDREAYYAGMIRFISRYAAGEAPKYPVARVQWSNQSERGASGVMVDSTIVLADGTSYDVRWLLGRFGNTYKVRDAMVMGFWMTPFLKKLFEDYIAQNGGNPRALTMALNR